MATGDWYKIAVEQPGVFKITHAQISAMGINPSGIDPRNIKIYGQGAGMLPQKNDVVRPYDLQEKLIRVVGEADGQFNTQDYILFYGEGPDIEGINTSGNPIFQKNIFENKNFYYLTIGTTPGMRVNDQQNQSGSFPVISSFNDFKVYKKELVNRLLSGRVWYGELFDITTDRTFNFDFGNIAPGSQVQVISAVMAESFDESKFTLSIGQFDLGEQVLPPVPDHINNSGDFFRYGLKGHERIDTFNIGANMLNLQSTVPVRLRYQKNSSARSRGYLNYILLSGKRVLGLYGDQTRFRSVESLTDAVAKFEINSSTGNNILVWDITNPGAPKNQQFNFSSGKIGFSTITSSLKEFVVFNTGTILHTPEFIEKVSNQNLKDGNILNMVIVSNPAFLSEAQRLADFRAGHSNMKVRAVTTTEIYNEFSSGKQDVTAIRDYLKYLFDLDYGASLQHVLLFGRASFDYKNITSNNTNFVPTYQSRNSLHPLNTYSSDDYYAFLEDGEGEWVENDAGNHTLDIGVGRLPVKTLEEAAGVVTKIIHYQTHPSTFGTWRNTIGFIADDENNNLHQRDADRLATMVDTAYAHFGAEKIYLDAYPNISQPGGAISPATNSAINDLIEKGALIVNYTGHGSERQLSQKAIVDNFMIDSWTNFTKLPLFVTATCEFGRHDNPILISGGERVVINPQGGGIALVSTSRPVSAFSNFELNRSFYSEVFKIGDEGHLTLGETFKNTKNNSFSGVRNRNFILLGDPSIKLNFPEQELVITHINEAPIEDVNGPIQALSKVKISGKVRDRVTQGDIEDFNGEVSVTFFDRAQTLQTLGVVSPVFDFDVWSNAIFRGKATVDNGKFDLEFVVTKNIGYSIDQSRITMYALDKNKYVDANGANMDLAVWGTNPNAPPDHSGPEVNIYINDPSFQPGGFAPPQSRLLVKLSDESGINISGFGLGNNITAILDNDQEFVLNDFYTAEIDDYTQGWVNFSLPLLSKGPHTIRVKAWDTYNNPGESVLHFIVTDKGEMIIETLFNYPNPFRNQTGISMIHSRSGDDLEIIFSVYSSQGVLETSWQYDCQECPAEIRLEPGDLPWLQTINFQEGIYFLRAFVRSLTDGAKNQKHQKMLILK